MSTPRPESLVCHSLDCAYIQPLAGDPRPLCTCGAVQYIRINKTIERRHPAEVLAELGRWPAASL